MRLRSASLFAVAALALLPAAKAAAQPGPGGDYAEARRAREDTLHAALRLRPDQEADWTAYLAAVDAERGGLRQGGEDAAGLTAPERMDAMVRREEARLDGAKRRAAATRALYARLSLEQQRAFDAQTASDRTGGGRGRWSRGDGG